MATKDPVLRGRSRRSSIFQANPNCPERANRLLIDYFTQIEEVSASKFINVTSGEKKKSDDKFSSPHLFRKSYLLALILLGFSASLIGFFQELAVQCLQNLRIIVPRTGYFIADFLLWMGISIGFCLISGYLSSFIPKSAEESEIAEVKAVIAGVKIPYFFEGKVLIFKLFTVIFAISGGISMGIEGAFVHISAIISNQLATKIKMFNYINKNKTVRNQFLEASVSAGLASEFGTVIGALMFSIELSSSYFIVGNMWRMAFCTLCCSIFKELLQLTGIEEVINNCHFKTIEMSLEILSFALLGILSGILGYIFISLSRFIVYHRINNSVPRLHKRFAYLLAVCVISSVLTYGRQYLMLSDISILNDMFEQDVKRHGWKEDGFAIGLSVYFIVKFISTVLATSLELPVGIIFPMLACGAVFGRLFGLFAMEIFGEDYGNIYAAVGSAALVSATTHSITISIVVFSMTGEIHYLIPMILAVFLAYGVSNFFTISFYDTMLDIKQITYMPLLRSANKYKLTANTIKSNSFPCMTVESTLRDLVDAIFEAPIHSRKIPVINRNGILLFEVSIKNCINYFCRCYNRAFYTLSLDSQETFNMITKRMKNLYRKPYSCVNSEMKPKDYRTTKSIEVKLFLSQTIDLNDEYLNVDDAPFSIIETTVFAKIQFMFFMLNLSEIYVTDKGVLVGIIYRDNLKG